jgi:hypothetical protein
VTLRLSPSAAWTRLSKSDYSRKETDELRVDLGCARIQRSWLG